MAPEIAHANAGSNPGENGRRQIGWSLVVGILPRVGTQVGPKRVAQIASCGGVVGGGSLRLHRTRRIIILRQVHPAADFVSAHHRRVERLQQVAHSVRLLHAMV